jgi:hypothetical protein
LAEQDWETVQVHIALLNIEAKVNETKAAARRGRGKNARVFAPRGG